MSLYQCVRKNGASATKPSAAPGAQHKGAVSERSPCIAGSAAPSLRGPKAGSDGKCTVRCNAHHLRRLCCQCIPSSIIGNRKSGHVQKNPLHSRLCLLENVSFDAGSMATTREAGMARVSSVSFLL